MSTYLQGVICNACLAGREVGFLSVHRYMNEYLISSLGEVQHRKKEEHCFYSKLISGRFINNCSTFSHILLHCLQSL